MAAGKGVLLPETAEEALTGLKSIMLDNTFGEAGNFVVNLQFETEFMYRKPSGNRRTIRRRRS